jgi:formylglycine-generating enzyme required for sulfatase activity/predicted esterase
MGRFLEELKRRKVFRVAGAYVVAAWVVLQVAGELVPILELPDWTSRLVFLLLVIGFLPAVIMAWAFELSSDGVRPEREADGSTAQRPPRVSPVAASVITVLALAFAGAGGYYLLTADARWARDEAFPRIEAHADAGEWEAAYTLAKEVERRLPDSEALAELWQTIGFTTTIESAPAGASVSRRPYMNPDAKWQSLGTTPLSDIHIPFGLSVIRLELEGRPSIERIVGGETAGRSRLSVRNQPHTGGAAIPPGGFDFGTAETVPEGMVSVPGFQFQIRAAVFGTRNVVDLAPFFVGRFEVTNREYKVFVDSDGYQADRFWEHPFVDNGETIAREAAMARFVDESGRPGPSSWVGGTYPDGKADHPVTGISWYEAAAYAAFMSRELPTVHHWRRAHAAGMIQWQLETSNIESDGTVAVGELPSMGWTGTYDMIGNAREWTWNEMDGQRVIVGGSYGDPAYYAHHSIEDPFATSPFNRDPENGFRLAETRDPPQAAEQLRAPVEPQSPPDVGQPVGRDVLDAYLGMFDYTARPLDPEFEEVEELRHWTRHRISITSHKDGERLPLYLYLPSAPATSYQPIVYWPTINALFSDSIEQQFVHLDFALRNGRAVVFPVYAGTLERRGDAFPDWASIAGRDLVINAIKDMRRAVDYLESRADIDEEKIAFYGYSWGGRLGAIAMTVEPRIKVGVLNQAGLQHLAIPETSVVNYLPYVSQPVLQFNGRYDTDFDFETASVPFFESLGTPASDKKHVVSDTSHYVPRKVVIGETLDWLDKYLGPPNR